MTLPTFLVGGEDKKPVEECWCKNGGSCEYHNHIYGHHHPFESATCKCRKGFGGLHCEKALCRPGCAHGGTCVAPDVCSCPDGYTGARCQTGTKIQCVFTILYIFLSSCGGTTCMVKISGLLYFDDIINYGQTVDNIAFMMLLDHF